MRLINQPQQQKHNILPLFTVLIFGVNLLALTLLIFNASMLTTITSRLPQVLGQLTDGEAIKLAPQAYNHRHSESIRRFLGETLTLMFTWSEKQSPETVLNFSSGLFAPSLRNRLISEITPEGSNDKIKSVFIIQNISQPQELKPGIWQLSINARRIIFLNQDMNGASVDWQKNVVIAAVDHPPIQLEKPANSLHRVVNKLATVKLQIQNICDINLKNCRFE